MLELNDDCLVNIFQFLDINSAITASRACRRFKMVFDYIWAVQYKTLNFHYYVTTLKEPDLHTLLGSICGTVRSVQLNFFPASSFAVLAEFTYPRAEELIFAQLAPLSIGPRVLRQLIAAFPNLRTFRPHANFTGKYLSRWSTLEDVTLTHCKQLQPEYFCEMARDLNLKVLALDLFRLAICELPALPKCQSWFRNIESLIVNTFEFVWITDNGLTDPFAKLETLKITNRNSIWRVFRWVHDFKAADVVELELTPLACGTNFPFRRILDLYMPEYEHLTKLKICERQDNTTLRCLTLLIKKGNLSKLREVYLFKCALESMSETLDLLKCSLCLDLVSIEKCTLQYPELVLCAHNIHRGDRDHPFRINFCNNQFLFGGIVQLEVVGTSELLQVTNKRILQPSRDPALIKFKKM